MEECIKYKGSYICVFSSQLFLIASLFNFILGNYIESIAIFAMYMSSVSYHKNPNDENKIIDEYIVRIAIFICMALSLYNYNIFPTLATIIISVAYYTKTYCENCSYCNLYHALFVHFIGFLGFISIYYNKK